MLVIYARNYEDLPRCPCLFTRVKREDFRNRFHADRRATLEKAATSNSGLKGAEAVPISA